jgi:hypothetical protein
MDPEIPGYRSVETYLLALATLLELLGAIQFRQGLAS